MIQRTISKFLTANDSGETGAHQAGLLIPKQGDILSFFPSLDSERLNPRVHLQFRDHIGRAWNFSFIHYNNRRFGGTRNEFRLTRMTKYIREANLRKGDEIQMHRDVNGDYSISHRRARNGPVSKERGGKTVIKLGASWRVVKIKR